MFDFVRLLWLETVMYRSYSDKSIHPNGIK
jgi:hypothetical protein